MTLRTTLRRTPRRRDEAGQITAMLVLLTACLILLISAVTDVSAAYLRRQAVTSLADGAALAATEAAAAPGVYGQQQPDYVTISAEAAELAVRDYLAATGAYAEHPGLDAAVSVDGYTVRVALTVPFDLPVPVPGAVSTVDVHGSASSVMPIYHDASTRSQ